MKIKRTLKRLSEKSLQCLINNHRWYFGFYSNPVQNRYERRCTECSRKEYESKGTWIVYNK